MNTNRVGSFSLGIILFLFIALFLQSQFFKPQLELYYSVKAGDSVTYTVTEMSPSYVGEISLSNGSVVPIVIEQGDSFKVRINRTFSEGRDENKETFLAYNLIYENGSLTQTEAVEGKHFPQFVTRVGNNPDLLVSYQNYYIEKNASQLSARKPEDKLILSYFSFNNNNSVNITKIFDLKTGWLLEYNYLHTNDSQYTFNADLNQIHKITVDFPVDPLLLMVIMIVDKCYLSKTKKVRR